MKILFFTYPVAFVTPGGGEIQLLETRKALQALGVQVDLYDMWHPNIADYDVIHLFSVQAGVRQLQMQAKERGIKIVNSPIMWIRKGAGHYDMHNLYGVLANSDLVLPNSLAEKEAFLDAEFILYEGESAVLSKEGLKVTLLGIFDSTCPAGARCIWQGEKGVRIQVFKDNEDLGEQILALPGGRSPNSMEIRGYFIKLLSIGPDKICITGPCPSKEVAYFKATI